MLVFIDESWQQVGGRRVGALGAVAIPQRAYNPFCREVYAWKARILGAVELNDCELKGNDVFAKAAFKRQAAAGDSKMLQAAWELFGSLRRYRARAFVVWTQGQALLTLRNPSTTALSDPYKALLYDLRRYMSMHRRRLAHLNFDQRQVGTDERTACAIQNLLVRARGWRGFLHVPNFTVSAVSPGLQAADLVAYLGARFSDERDRPELGPFLEELRAMATHRAEGRRRKTAIREIETRAPL